MTATPEELQEASDPATQPARLTELANHGKPGIRERVVANPSAELALALVLCRDFPDAFLTNPAIPLWCLENPSFFHDLPPLAGAAIAR